MKMLKRLKNGIKRGVEMVIKGVKELIAIVPCDKKLVVNIAKDVVLAIGGAVAIGAVLIVNDLNAYDKRMENGELRSHLIINEYFEMEVGNND